MHGETLKYKVFVYLAIHQKQLTTISCVSSLSAPERGV